MNHLARTLFLAWLLPACSCSVGPGERPAPLPPASDNPGVPDARDSADHAPTFPAVNNAGAKSAADNATQMTSYVKGAGHDYGVMTVLFATDRNLLPGPSDNPKFGADRSGRFTYGTCEVSIPRDHRLGAMESPSILRFEFRPDSDKHIVLLGTRIEDRQRFFANIKTKVQASGNRSTFLFVHGYNVSFEDAARRTAQIAYDLGFDGVPVFYSWPSQDKTVNYMVDEQTIEWAEPHLEAFLDDYLSASGADNVYIIAHSMGNRALTRALGALLKEKPQLAARIGEVILAAPDIDAEVFRTQLVPQMTSAKRPITLYASSKDRALVASGAFHGSPRAGEAGQSIVVVAGIETIDATNRSTDFISHSYYGDNDSILSDMFYMVRGRQAKDRFGLTPQQVPDGQYWVFSR